YQNGSEYTKYWGNGNVDILLKVKASGSLIDSGYITIFTRVYGYTYDHYKADLSNGGRTAVSVSNAADTNNTTLEATIAGWSDITVATAGAPYSIDLGDGAADYDVQVDCGGHAIQDVYEKLKYLAEEDQSGEAYTRADASYTEVKTAPYGTFAGGVFFGARGVGLINVATADALNYVLTDSANATHQCPSPPVAISAPNLIDDTRIQIYNVTTSTEIDNAVVAGGSGYSYVVTVGVDVQLDDVIRMRATYVDGATAKEPIEALGVITAAGCSFIDTQVDDAVYNAWAVDGSTVTEFSADYPNTQVDSDDADGETTKVRFGAWFKYNLTTEDGIANYFGGIETPSANVIKVITATLDLKIDNVSTTALRFTDTDVRLYRDDNTTLVATGSTGSIGIDYSGVPDVVETGTSGLTTAESNKLDSIYSNAAEALTEDSFLALK
ncbi:MAG: hypothetical protein PHY90_12245, partial [Desulfitobacteriaceae bacterium]|nr:hypothetical protein [Desulfitobacteriaceae bacterium]